MQTYVITDNRRTQIRRMLAFKGGAETIKFDFSPWAEANGSPSSVVVTVKTGDATISNESLASDVKTFVVTTSNAGGSMLKLVATAGNNIYVTHLDVWAKDPDRQASDYGITQTA